MKRVSAGLFLVALTTLMLELTLIRVFDVIWYSNMAYMIITLAMFCFGLSGVYSSLRPFKKSERIHGYLSILSILFALFAIVILPLMNAIPFIRLLYLKPGLGFFSFFLMYFFLGVPFFLAGLIFTTVFSTYARKIQSLYFWDLSGAAIGCIILVPFLPKIGPGGLLFVACAFGLWASGLFSDSRKWRVVSTILGVLIILVPFFHADGYLDFKEQLKKRGVKSAREKGAIERTYWDPISKIDVIGLDGIKHIAYDGGTQSSWIIPFDGNLDTLRDDLANGRGHHFVTPNLLTSHYLKRDTKQRVLVIGSAGGQEIKAALAYGADHVDAVELVNYVVEIGKNHYSDYNGNIFCHPRVNAITGEGRSFLRSSDHQYDIIQIFSNHTSSSIAGGAGAMATNYLQTAEAYEEYFSHLSEDGILHINHHIYPRMVTTAALAWRQMGRDNFKAHVVVCESAARVMDNLPTLLVKMSPWTPAEIEEIKQFYGPVAKIVEHPLEPDSSFLSADFYTGQFPPELAERMPFRVNPATDDKPYFNFLRKEVRPLIEDPKNFLNFSTAKLLNSQLKKTFIPRVPKDILPLVVIGAASFFFTAIFIFIPLYFSEAGKSKWPRKASSLFYFACLGAGFIIFELIFIQIFMKLIGYPLYTYSTVVFTMLLAAGVGSLSSEKLNIGLHRRWVWPFVGILVTGVFILATHSFVFDIFLTTNTAVRIAVAISMIFPLGFFLGMPFPLGILAIEKQPTGAIAWAWGLNGFFTLIGGLLSVLLSIYVGFSGTILVALFIYCMAFLMFSRIREAGMES